MTEHLKILEQRALQTIMNPHFVFNVINAIQHFINTGEKGNANKYLADFAKLIRMNAAFSGKSMILLEEELQYLNLYLSFEKLRLGDQLLYEVIIDASVNTGKTSVPVMMIQPFIENAIWHGIQPMKEKGEVQLHIVQKNEKILMIKVIDNGVGIQKKFTGYNILDKAYEDDKLKCIAIQRLRLLKATTKEPLSLNYHHLYPNLIYKGTIAEFTLPFSH